MKVLADYKPQELQDLSSQNQEEHRRLYKRAIREAAANVKIPEDILMRLTELEDHYRGPRGAETKFKYARQRGLNFIEAYLISRFGEDPRVWPPEIDWAPEAARLDRWVASPPQTWGPDVEDE